MMIPPRLFRATIESLETQYLPHISLYDVNHTFHNKPDGSHLNTRTPKPNRKAQIDAVILKFPGVIARKISNLDAYFIDDKMFACISGNGVGLRVSASAATELQFSRSNVVPFKPSGIATSREWIQIDRADAADYEHDLDLFRASLEFVKSTRSR